jgi:hypothetical protein
MDRQDQLQYEHMAKQALCAAALLLLSAAVVGIGLFSDREGFWRDQAIKRALAEERAAEREFGPVIPTSFNL